jgi:hypothetical protein
MEKVQKPSNSERQNVTIVRTLQTLEAFTVRSITSWFIHLDGMANVGKKKPTEQPRTSNASESLL